ncbi:hypothetical protein [Blastococcus sp. CT_GayMR16]|uniref:hypothetical protein n=1 Tax=Blastococcus sp. CT_GayMR16 TaxID=2559607 RepID=UPI0010748D91|nr:hypothetical protein [Blastococcus sp. CT_GayMR16]TFV85846.1 hypothetical protein E4P38_18995 [Blastococcus sp. CT_GayMR16]
MEIRRPIVALITALTLVGGGALTACGDPTESGTGTPKDTAENTSGNDPSDESQGNLPDNSDPDEDSDPDSGSGTGNN